LAKEISTKKEFASKAVAIFVWFVWDYVFSCYHIIWTKYSVLVSLNGYEYKQRQYITLLMLHVQLKYSRNGISCVKTKLSMWNVKRRC